MFLLKSFALLSNLNFAFFFVLFLRASSGNEVNGFFALAQYVYMWCHSLAGPAGIFLNRWWYDGVNLFHEVELSHSLSIALWSFPLSAGILAVTVDHPVITRNAAVFKSLSLICLFVWLIQGLVLATGSL